MKKDFSIIYILQLACSLLFGAYFFSSATVGAAVIGLVRVVSAPWDRQGRLAHTLTRWLASHYIRMNPFWRVSVEDADIIDPTSHRIFVANHQSLLDVLVLSRLPVFYKWVAKAQIWRMMGVGELMRINGHISVSHGDLRSVRRMLRRSKEWLRANVSIFIFPEGERSFDGTLLRFKDGPFRLACDTDTAIQPVVLDGTINMMRRGSPLINFCTPVRIKLLPPIHPRSVNYDPRRLNDAVHAAIARELGQASKSDIFTDDSCVITEQTVA